jgi:hypothetical protein
MSTVSSHILYVVEDIFVLQLIKHINFDVLKAFLAGRLNT